MLCGRCHGQHFIFFAGQTFPCPECGGVGEVNCCDGLMVQTLVSERELADNAVNDHPAVCPLFR